LSDKVLKKRQEWVRPQNEGRRKITLGRIKTIVVIETKRPERVCEMHFRAGFIAIFVPAKDSSSAELIHKKGPDLQQLLD
jgi:hypothetical protein